MSCKGFEGEDDQIAFRKMFEEGKKSAEKRTRINVVITMPGVPQRQINYGGLTTEIPNDEKKIIKLVGVHRAIAKKHCLLNCQ